MKKLCYAACSFGLESAVSRELSELGMEDVQTRNARVYFRASQEEVARANLCLACADRVYIVLKEFEARTFDELFEGVKSIPFADYIPKTAAFPVAGDAVQSTLMSVSDIQSVVKKAEIGRAHV